MVHKGKSGTRSVTLDIAPELRNELMRLTGAKTLTEAIYEALADLVLRELAEGPLRKRRTLERQWVADKGLGLPRRSEISPHAGERPRD